MSLMSGKAVRGAEVKDMEIYSNSYERSVRDCEFKILVTFVLGVVAIAFFATWINKKTSELENMVDTKIVEVERITNMRLIEK